MSRTAYMITKITVMNSASSRTTTSLACDDAETDGILQVRRNAVSCWSKAVAREYGISRRAGFTSDQGAYITYYQVAVMAQSAISNMGVRFTTWGRIRSVSQRVLMPRRSFRERLRNLHRNGGF